MGFFSDLGKAFMGQQASNQNSPQPQSTSAPQTSGIVDESGRKIIPDIDAKNLRSQRNGDKLIVKTWIENRSDQLIRVDTSYLLKQKRTHNQQINPRDSREITLYDGEIPDNDNEDNAQITFRLQVNGDVFMENYRVNFDLEPDGKFKVGDLIDDGPVRDL